MGIQKEACPWCAEPFTVSVREACETFRCLECGRHLTVIRDPFPDRGDIGRGRSESLTLSLKVAGYLLEMAKNDLEDLTAALAEGLKVNSQALEACQRRIERLQREVKY